MGSESPVRDLLRRFAPGSQDPLLLRWDSALEGEQGSGLRLAVLDSGICWAHPVFQGAQIQARDFTGSGGVYDSTGHGTKCAALLIAQGAGLFQGLAPGSLLLAGKVMPVSDSRVSAVVLADAIRWALSERADIIILPLGRVQGTSIVTGELRRAAALGCKLIASAGNRGPDSILFPANLAWVTAVSAADPDGNPLYWCSQHPKVDCFAPGQEVASIGVEGLGTFSGSSPATILAAGVAALHLSQERHRKGVKTRGGKNAAAKATYHTNPG